MTAITTGSELRHGSDSTVPGFTSADIDMGRLLDTLRVCEHDGVHYGLGAKANPIEQYPPTFHAIDCSGFVRYAWYHATGGMLIEDGSSNQNDQFAQRGFKHYGKAEYGLAAAKDNVLRIGFCRANPSERIGHVWFLFNGFTIESCGGHGPTSRPWNTPVLERIVTDLYVIGRFPGV